MKKSSLLCITDSPDTKPLVPALYGFIKDPVEILDHVSEFLDQESEECIDEESVKFIDHNSEEFSDREPEEFLDQTSKEFLGQETEQSSESDASSEYMSIDTDSSHDYYIECTNGNESDKQEDPEDTYIVIVPETNKKESNTRFNCEICKLTFNNKTDTSEHLLLHSSSKECEICNSIMDKNAYSIHMKLHKESYKQGVEKNKRQCKVCGKMVSKAYLKFHMLAHGSHQDKLDRMKQCPICDKSLNYYYFNDHMKRMHHNSQEYTSTIEENVETCPICDRSVKASKIKEHIASHGKSVKESYVCEQCGKILKHYSAFQTHLLTHTGNLTYKCEYCPYRGLHLGLLKVHVRTHTKDYPYQCSECLKKFLTKSNLSQHEKSHKPPGFCCSKCKKKFSSKRSLDLHIKTIHLNIRNEECDDCGKTFGTTYALKAHKKSVHRMQPQQTPYRGRTANYLKAELSVQTKQL